MASSEFFVFLTQFPIRQLFEPLMWKFTPPRRETSKPS